MKKILYLPLFLLISGGFISAQDSREDFYAVCFYNLENLFDTIHDENKRDSDFLPQGSYGWNSTKYRAKIKNMSTVISQLGTDVLPDVGASIVGVCEVENKRVLTDLVNHPFLKKKNMQYIHIEGPDERGIDCAVLYNPLYFKPRKSFLQPYRYEPTDSVQRTRGFLVAQGAMAHEEVTVIVCHWPSRFSSSYYRERAGSQVKQLKDSIMAENPQMKILVMGDMNDDPFDKSVSESLGAKKEVEQTMTNELYNPWWNILEQTGKGTLTYKGKWNLFDQILLSSNLLNKNKQRDSGTLKYHKSEIFRRDYLIQSEGKYKGHLKRTTAGRVWLNGYSDHLPVIVYLSKAQK